MKFTLNRDYCLVTTDGRAYGFKKGEPVEIPRRHADLAMAIGAVPQEDDVEAATAAVADAKAVAEDAFLRKEAIKTMTKEIVARNEPTDFTAAGRPNLKKMGHKLGFDVGATEFEPIWEAVIAEREA